MVNEGVNVVGPMFITKYDGRIEECCSDIGTGFFPTDGEPRTVEIRNVRDITVDVNVPIERYAIPESTDEKAILIKALGNHTTISIQWVIHSEDTNIVLQTLDVPGCCITPSETCAGKGGVSIVGGAGCTKSINNQLKWWANVFQSNSIDDRYHLYLGDCICNPIPNKPPVNTGCPPSGGAAQEITNQLNSEAYHKDGVLQNFRATLTGATPVTYTAQATFYVGEPQATPNECFTQG